MSYQIDTSIINAPIPEADTVTVTLAVMRDIQEQLKIATEEVEVWTEEARNWMAKYLAEKEAKEKLLEWKIKELEKKHEQEAIEHEAWLKKYGFTA